MVGLDIRSRLAAPEHVVGRQVRERDVSLRAGAAHSACPDRVHAKCRRGLGLAEVNGLEDGAVDEEG